MALPMCSVADPLAIALQFVTFVAFVVKEFKTSLPLSGHVTVGRCFRRSTLEATYSRISN